MNKMYTFMYEPMTRQNEYIVNGGITHAVNTSRIEDIQFWGDMASVCLVSGAKFNVTRDEAILLLDSLDRCGEGASKEIAYMEDAGMRYESAKRDRKKAMN
jgi:hypothetical protein